MKTCKWRLRAMRANDKDDVQWLVKRYNIVHTCQNDIFHNGHRQANNRVVGEIIK